MGNSAAVAAATLSAGFTGLAQWPGCVFWTKAGQAHIDNEQQGIIAAVVKSTL